MQLKLSFLESVDPTTPLWAKLDPEAQRALVHALARAIEKAACPQQNDENPEDSHDR